MEANACVASKSFTESVNDCPENATGKTNSLMIRSAVSMHFLLILRIYLLSTPHCGNAIIIPTVNLTFILTVILTVALLVTAKKLSLLSFWQPCSSHPQTTGHWTPQHHCFCA
jgi:hypothetical protein